MQEYLEIRFFSFSILSSINDVQQKKNSNTIRFSLSLSFLSCV